MLERYTKSTFVRGFASLLTGSAIAQLIPLAISPYISRAFSVEEVALFGIYLSLVSTFAVIMSGKYDMTIVLPKNEDDGVRLVHLSALVALVVSVFFAGLIMGFKHEIAGLLKNPSLEEWLWILPISLFVIGLYQPLNYWLIRHRRFKSSAINKVSQRVSEGGVVVMTGESGVFGGLLISDVIGRFTMTVVAFIQALRYGFGTVSWSFSEMKRLAGEYKEYPGNFAFSSLANAAAMHVPLLFISNAYLVTITGYFNLMKYVLSVPIAFISRNIAQVFLERLASKWRKGEEVLGDFLRLSGFLTGISVLFVLPIALFGEELFSFVFGEEWASAGSYAEIMALSFGIKFVVSPLSSLLNAINRISIASWWQWAYFLAILSLIPASQNGWNIETFLYYYLALESVCYIVYWCLILEAARKHDVRLKRA